MMKVKNEVVSISRGNSILVDWEGRWVFLEGDSRYEGQCGNMER